MNVQESKFLFIRWSKSNICKELLNSINDINYQISSIFRLNVVNMYRIKTKDNSLRVGICIAKCFIPMRWNIFFFCRCCIRIAYPEKICYTHIIIYAVISCNEVHKTKDCFCSTKVFSSAIFTSCVYYILYRRYAINWKKFYFSSQDKRLDMESSWRRAIILSIRYNPQTTSILN